MRVLHLIGGGDVGGAKSHVLYLVKELSKHIDVKIISFRPGVFADEAVSMGIDIEIVKTGNYISDIKRVIEIIKTGNYDIIHSHGAKANMSAVFIKYLTKTPAVTTVHSDYRLDYMGSFSKHITYGLINKVALRLVDYYIAVSRNFKKMLIERGFKADRISVLYNGIDFNKSLSLYQREQFAQKYKLDINGSDTIVGILGRLDPVKDQMTFINAANEVLKKRPSVKFIVGGDGELRKELEGKVRSLGIAGNVLFPGWIDDPYEFMSSIDIDVLTSISESFPYTILEGARFKKATISSNVGGISDLIENGTDGLLFEPGDYNKLADHMLALIDNSTLREEMGRRIYEKASSQFSLEKMCESQLGIYNAILDDQSRSAAAAVNMHKSYDAIISGYYGSGNIGDDAILTAITGDLRTYRKDARILVLSRNPFETRKAYNVDSVYKFNIIKVLRAMNGSSLFINGGGSLIQDISSSRSLVYFLGMIWMAKKMKLKVMVYANGIGPINKPFNRKLARRVLNQVDMITLRENLSAAELQNIRVVKPPILVTADPALTIKPVCNGEIDALLKSEGINPSGLYAGISVRKWDDPGNYKETISKIADYLVEKYGITPVFIPMHYPEDLYIIESIAEKMKHKSLIIRNKYDASHMLGIIKKMQLLIGMRLHALIFAASMGIPVIGLEYEQKVEGFLQYINLFPQASAGHVNNLQYNKLEAAVDYVWSKREAISVELQKTMPLLKNKAMENSKIAIELIEKKECAKRRVP
jgi:polysaccharide pyruvyl transferase CsaB